MKFTRLSGVLLHPTSLPGKHGIGELGDEAYRFADFLAASGFHLWQILPLGPTGYGNSPYASLSVFAGNPLLISIEKLAQDNLIELEPGDLPSFPDQRVDFEAVRQYKIPLFKRAFEKYKQQGIPGRDEDFAAFRQQNKWWLDPYSLFMSLKEAHNNLGWNDWEEKIRVHMPEAVDYWTQRLQYQMEFHQFQQYLFFGQWFELKKYCNQRGISFIGDMPIFINFDSDTVWWQQELFYLDEKGNSTVVAGVPPDYFSSTGQLWGNPLYRWDIMKQQGYSWWIKRFQSTLATVDIVRLDHFRGFESYWEVPATEHTAINGQWKPGPGIDFFVHLENALGTLPVIAEDLGMITLEVRALRNKLGFPGMRVLQFAFGGDPKTNEHIPFNHSSNCVVYTGTHDNNTTVGWFNDVEDNTTMSPELRLLEKQRALDYTGTDGSNINWDFTRLALSSVADTSIIPLQDILGLGSEARMNIPGKENNNWEWRFTEDMLPAEIQSKLKKLNEIYGR